MPNRDLHPSHDWTATGVCRQCTCHDLEPRATELCHPTSRIVRVTLTVTYSNGAEKVIEVPATLLRAYADELFPK